MPARSHARRAARAQTHTIRRVRGGDRVQIVPCDEGDALFPKVDICFVVASHYDAVKKEDKEVVVKKEDKVSKRPAAYTQYGGGKFTFLKNKAGPGNRRACPEESILTGERDASMAKAREPLSRGGALAKPIVQTTAGKHWSALKRYVTWLLNNCNISVHNRGMNVDDLLVCTKLI